MQGAKPILDAYLLGTAGSFEVILASFDKALKSFAGPEFGYLAG